MNKKGKNEVWSPSSVNIKRLNPTCNKWREFLNFQANNSRMVAVLSLKGIIKIEEKYPTMSKRTKLDPFSCGKSHQKIYTFLISANNMSQWVVHQSPLAVRNCANAFIGGIGRLSDALRTIPCGLLCGRTNGCFCGGAILHSTSEGAAVFFRRYWKLVIQTGTSKVTVFYLLLK